MIAYADDFSAAGSIVSLKHWWENLCKLGPKFGYFPEATKSWLIIKPNVSHKAHNTFRSTNIQITAKGKRHLGAVIGTNQYRQEYTMEKIDKWVEEMHVLSQPRSQGLCLFENTDGARQKALGTKLVLSEIAKTEP